MIKYILLCLIFTGTAWSGRLTDNTRVSGTPVLGLNESNLRQLSRRTSLLHKPYLHKPTAKPTLGEQSQFYTFDFENDKYIQVTATLRYNDGNINIWVSDAEWANGHVTAQVVQQVYEGLMVQTPASSIDSNEGIVEIIQASFGLPPNFDGDGITDFLLTDIRDGWQE